MTDLRIADAPELTAAELNDSLKVPTGGFGNYSITMITIRDWLLNYKMFATQSYVDTQVGTVTTTLNNHTSRIDNPHQVTKSQVGLGNVDNTSDINKPISSATQTALTNLNTSLTSAISVKANASDVYTKSEVYKKVESDNKYHQKLSIDGILAPTAVFDDVKNIDGVNGTPDLIINQPIQNLANRTEFLKTHNNLTGRDAVNAHPSSSIQDSSGKTQQQLNNYILGDIYYADAEGFINDGVTDNSTAWDTLLAKLNHGDTVIFNTGTYVFNSSINITKVINVEGKQKSYTTLKFPNSTNGVVRHVRGGRLKDFGIYGTKTATVLDPENKVFGTIGLYDRYDEVTSFAGYTETYNVQVNNFDCGRVNATEGSSTWNGAYRESRDCWIQTNRIGCVFLNGATDDKYFGGIISANSEIGIWAHDGGTQYNNIKFVGTTIESNGVYDSSIGYLNTSPSKCNIYCSGNSSIYLIGSYNEKCYNIVEDGGQLYKIGSHQHSNTIDTTKNGFVYYSGVNWGELYNIPYYNRLPSFLYAFSGLSTATVANSKAVRVTSTLNQSGVGYALRSRDIALPSGISVNKLRGARFRMKFKITSGYTRNVGLRPNIDIYFYAKDGSYAGVRNGFFSKYQLSGGINAEVDISANAPISTVAAPTAWNFNPNTELSHVRINIGFINESGAFPDFSTDNLDMTIYDLDVGFFAREDLNLTTWSWNAGTTAQRPLLLTEDYGYRYFDSTLGKLIIWNGTSWEVSTNSNDLIATSTTSTSLTTASNAVNTSGKYRGRMVHNTSNSKFYIATGSSATDVWVSTDSTSTLTPA